MPPQKSNLNNGPFADGGDPPETWESFLNQFPGAPVLENDLDRTLAALFDAPPAAGPAMADVGVANQRARPYATGETDPLMLFRPGNPPASRWPAPWPGSAGDATPLTHTSPDAPTPSNTGMGEVTPPQRRAMLAALQACIDAVLPGFGPEHLPPGPVRGGIFPAIGAQKRRAALRAAHDLRYRQAVEQWQNESDTLFNETFLTVYLREMAKG
ncbi:hypothetical protein [Acerihabitans arboris]|uniref:Uncharacterized protein n=1 Tax=Acerihabitans arboris TaxID=2691583 RepID=A0A845SH05_9GAMM|nr:hypothetical protein [Acerihabitans arboris]NDL64393.1 hypothetical protein [Acerihabitans arboris]